MRLSIFAFFTILIMGGCSNDDDAPLSSNLAGVWNLIDVTCFCPPSNFQGEHIWDFNIADNSVFVQNMPDEDLQILSTGNHSIFIDGETITIENVTYDFYFTNGDLYLSDQPELDGPILKFIKSQE